MGHIPVFPIDIGPIGPRLTKAGQTAGERTAVLKSVVGAYSGLHRQRLLCPVRRTRPDCDMPALTLSDVFRTRSKAGSTPRVPASCIIEMIELRRQRLKIGATTCVRPSEERRVR
jgi:hypothetical protein